MMGDTADAHRPDAERRGLSQGAAANLAGIQAQTVSRLERGEDARLSTLRRYLGVPRYTIENAVVEATTGAVAGRIHLPAHPP